MSLEPRFAQSKAENEEEETKASAVGPDRTLPTTMQAVVQESYGSVDDLKVETVPVPQPEADQVLIRVVATSVHPDVWHVVTGSPGVLRYMGAGRRRPKCPIPGTDVAGVVVATGQNVARFSVGDEVFGETMRGMQWQNGGSYAEYVAAPEDCVAHKPRGVSFEQAASVPTSGYIAYMNLQEGLVEPTSRVLVNGAGGGVGTIALQLCKARGAHVTAVDHGSKLDMLRRLGADEVIDYTQTNFSSQSARYDLVFDVVGNHSFAECRRVLRPAGKYVLIGHDHFGASRTGFFGLIPTMLGLMLRTPFTPHLREASFSMPGKIECWETLGRLLETGQLTPAIHRCYPLEEITRALHEMMREEALGKILLTPVARPRPNGAGDEVPQFET